MELPLGDAVLVFAARLGSVFFHVVMPFPK